MKESNKSAFLSKDSKCRNKENKKWQVFVVYVGFFFFLLAALVTNQLKLKLREKLKLERKKERSPTNKITEAAIKGKTEKKNCK